MKLSKKENNSKFIYVITIIIAILITIYPILLKYSVVRNITSWFLSDLGNYKDSYISMMGALIGSYIAITGAIWTQRKFNEEEEKQEIKKYCTIVYYDMIRSIDFIRKIYIEHICNIEGNSWSILISENWIENIAMLSNVLQSEDIENLYELSQGVNELLDCLEKLRLNTPKYVEENWGDISSGTIRYVDDSYKELESKREKIIVKLGNKVLKEEVVENINNDKNNHNILMNKYYKEDLREEFNSERLKFHESWQMKIEDKINLNTQVKEKYLIILESLSKLLI